MIWLRSAVFVVTIYALMMAMGVVGLPLVITSRDLTYWWMRLYARTVFRLARVMCGLETEIRGTMPEGACVVVGKHQSLLDVLMIYAALPRPKFVMKRSLLWAPVFGQYTWRLGTITVDRGARGEAKRMVQRAMQEIGEEGQFVIYPQGTRVAPGDHKPYRRGAAMIAEATGLPVILAATNAGWFWPRRGILRRPGRAIVEFLGEMAPCASLDEMMARMEATIEPASDRLGEEARASLAHRGLA